MKKDETQEFGKDTEYIDDTVYISPEYLSVAASMVSWQILHTPKEKLPKDELDFNYLVTMLYRQHVPFAYSFLYQQAQAGQDIIPQQTLDAILQFIRQQPGFTTFLGKTNGGIILA